MPMRRTLKNVVKNYTDAQVKVREATSNDPWGPSSTLMTEIADLTYNVVAFTEIMQMIWKRLNDHGKNWRHVYKSLVVLDYIIKTGSEKVAQQCKENIYAIQTLKDFQYTEDNKDQGMNVREKAKQLVMLLKDDERLRNERAKALKAKERFAQNSQGVGSQPSRSASAESPTFKDGSSGGYSESYEEAGETGSPTRRRRHSSDIDAVRPSSIGEEELQLQLALAMSREEHEEELRKQKSDDIKLQLALDESRKESGSPLGQQTLLGLADQSRQKQQNDPWGTSSLPAPPGSHHRAPPPAANDPWGSPAHAPVPPPVATDPWASPSHQPIVSQSSDPWGTPGATSDVGSSPWGTPVSMAAAQRQHQSSPFDSSFGSPATTNGTNGTNNVDDGFDSLISRTSPAKPASTEVKTDPWSLSDMATSLPGEQPKRTKTPQEFLGANSNLVNLDELVKPTEKKKANNPFATSPSTNPFEQAAPARVPLSQLQAESYTSGFTQTSTAGLLPAPLVPMGNAVQPQPQGYNPFL